jgi:hypothetical protein
MNRMLFPALPLLLAAPAAAHQDAGVLHLHPHGSEATIAAVALAAAAVLLWRVLRRRG